MIELLISSAILITVLAVMRFLFRGRIPPGFQYALWLLVLLRLALPFPLFPSPVSAAGAITQAIRVEQVDETGQTISQPDSDASVGADRQATGKPGFEQLFRYVWLGGSLTVAIWFGAVNRKLAIRLRHDRRRLEYPAPIPIYIADGLSSPCLCGLFHPAVYLTERVVSDPQRAGIAVTHELTHWRHRDNLWSAARILCLIVYWYDPFVWLAAHLSKQDGELFCDAGAVRMIGEEYRFAYGRALLEMSEAAARPSDLICSASTMSGGARRMRERIASVAHKPKRSIPASITAVLVTLAAAACTFSGPSEAMEAGPTQITPTSPPWGMDASAPEIAEATAAPKTIIDARTTPMPTPTPALQTEETTPMPTPTPAPQTEETAAYIPVYVPDAQNEEEYTPDGPDFSGPVPTSPAEETERVVVRDMRDVYMNAGLEPDPGMPSTVPNPPPPEAVPNAPEGE